jgi:parvulin-like peptidyl-prolyl isomerase
VSALIPAVLLGGLMMVGCSKKPSSDVLAKVGTHEITVQDFEQELNWYVQNGQPVPERGALLDQLVGRELRQQKARALGLDKDPDVRRRCEAVLAAKLEELELRPRIEKAQVAPAEVQAAYQKEITRYTRPAKVHLALICVKTERSMKPEQLAAAEASLRRAREAALALPPGTRGFGSVAVDYSDDQASRYRGGDVGWFDRGLIEYRWPADVVAMGFALTRNGEVSDVIKSNDGFYLVSRLDWREPSVTPLEQVQNGIRGRLLGEKRRDAELAFNRELRNATPVDLFPQALVKLQYPTTTPVKTEQPLPPLLGGVAVSSSRGTPPAN